MSKKHLGMAAGVLAGGLAAYALKVEPLLLELTRPSLPLPRLPEAWEGLTILLLTDSHIREWGERERRVVALCKTLDTPPDLVVWGGDFLGSYRGVVPAVRLVREVRALFPETPTLGIWGNAEHKIRPERRAWFKELLAQEGVEVLGNENRPFTLRGETIQLVACDDPYYGFADLECAFANLDPSRFTLFLAHSPQVAALADAAQVDLLLSGHTHGGQVRFPLLGPWKTQNPLSDQLDCGAFDHAALVDILRHDPGGHLTTYISRGIGVAFLRGMPWFAPRFNCRPELALLTLHRL